MGGNVIYYSIYSPSCGKQTETPLNSKCRPADCVLLHIVVHQRLYPFSQLLVFLVEASITVIWGMVWFARKLVQWKAKKNYFQAGITNWTRKQFAKAWCKPSIKKLIIRDKGSNTWVILSTDVAMDEKKTRFSDSLLGEIATFYSPIARKLSSKRLTDPSDRQRAPMAVGEFALCNIM